MNQERWRQVDKIFHEVLEQQVHERRTFLDRVCADDLSLRKEVEDLMRSYEEAASFLESPATGVSDGPVGLRPSSSLAGQSFGRYELRWLLGSGGMGDVYLARDSELKRDVAVKVLPDAFSKDAERVARFRREAEALASLNHPNIAAIYDLETLGELRCLVLELVVGETLADRLARGPIPIDEALRIAKQIAEALEAAHDKGVIHRDLKPSNIKISHDGTVKVLDFGLAKLRETHAASRVGAENTPATMATSPGIILGTMAYMSPEQARGKVVDKRADIWAFGCVFYEMLSGRAPFRRDSNLDMLAVILERDPEWAALPATTPANVRRLLMRCLEKDLRRRLHDIADARIEIEDVLSGATQAPAAAVASRQPTSGLRWSIVIPALLVALISISALIWKVLTPSVATMPPGLTFTIAPTGKEAVKPAGLRTVALTPDSMNVIYRGQDRTLFVQSLLQSEPKQILRTAPPLNFVFASADGQWIGFVEGTQLKKVHLGGGSVVSILDSNRPPSLGATFAKNDTVVFADEDPATGLQRVSDAGGEVKTLTTPVSGELDHVWPEAMPGGRMILYTITASTGEPKAAQVAVLDLDTGISKFVLAGGSHAHYVSSGHLIYTTEDGLQAIAFDPVRLETFGMPVSLLPSMVQAKGGGDFDVAANGSLVYVDGPNPNIAAAQRTLVWVDRQRKETPTEMQPSHYLQPRVSPDGKRVAVIIQTKRRGEGAIHIWDLAHQMFSQLTFASTGVQAPVWTPDGNYVVFFQPGALGGFTIFRQPANGVGEAEGLGRGGPPTDVTRDGWVLFSQEAKDLAQLQLDNPHQVQVLLQSPAREGSGVVSPNGKWMAYASNKSGQSEIYVAPYSTNPKPMQRLISSDGGTHPLWARSGQELFYVSRDGAIMALRFDPARGESIGGAQMVVEAGYVTTQEVGPRNYDVSLDGQRFLVVKQLPVDPGPPPKIVVVQNWSEVLKRLVPTKR